MAPLLFDLLLKYKSILRLPQFTDFALRLSRRTKALRALLADPRQAQLYAVTTPTRLALQETRDLLAACARMGIHVPATIINRATPPGHCPRCRARAHGEDAVRNQFRNAFPKLHLTALYHCADPRGGERLRAIGQALYTRHERTERAKP